MKKFVKIACFVIFISAVCVFLCSCVTKFEDKINACVSEYRENYFYTKSGDISASFTDGKREKNYVYDGKSSQLVDYGVILVFVKDFAGDKLKFEMKINDEMLAGEMERNPFDKSFVFDIERKVKSTDNLALYLVDFDATLNLENLSKSWKISCAQALTIFINANKIELKKYIVGDCFDGEIFIKIVSDKQDEDNIYFYVLAVLKDAQVFGALIDVNTGNIVQN